MVWPQFVYWMKSLGSMQYGVALVGVNQHVETVTIGQLMPTIDGAIFIAMRERVIPCGLDVVNIQPILTM